jgi:signal transduction histidine kinase
MAGVTIAFARPRPANVDVPLRYALAAWVAGLVLVPLFWGVWRATEAMTDAALRALGCATVIALAAFPAIRLGLYVGDRAVLRGRLRPGVAVSLLGRRLAAEPEADNAAEAVVSTVVDALGVPWARLVSPFAGLEATSPAGDESSQGDEFPITYQGERLAILQVPPRPGESELTRFDRDLLTQLAVHAGPALHGARTLSELSDAHARTVLAREEERRRLRRELHDDLGPALSGLALGAAAIAARAARVDPGIAATARELQADIGDAVARSREISHGLRPSVLDDRGLEAAIRDRLGPTADLRLDVGAIGDLAAAVDLAALRIVQEAVTNARRHASASVCSVRVDREGAVLRVEVADNGVGLPRTVTLGLGLRSIRERAAELGGRAHVSQPAGGGTLVSAWLPIGEGAAG